ncbi:MULTISPECIES: CDP-diacylglycerol--serine O-phosphatidyltransferase [Rheinheimera]|uniref:CDP-diacylglycerol--serine O-phosphatidyltransferase n=3 Tax=Rheinheimera TaxID=67575 RepID=A0ABN1D961_9GAMM|nr:MULTISPECIES: CDP-diacylglycerol--serine O-phosphatidyltransferase [Rheinheimera]MCB5212803.1 CDP-diacylglycerol--serine O-phosphatidyltransferase [Rheinheimera aquimaris]MCD1600420.1 CDP-diacylglycerol--serine O-phosphatidyltransferase [Rheinheimera aquimaris]HBN88254.1 CDP-diacylglycerol--serine O-phosphatidyltransferase [Rheinheimera sp.]
MTESKTQDTAPRKGIFLLPNLLTTGGLFSGFYAIVASMNGHFEAAAVAIFVAMIFDGLDGRVARLTNTQSEFGAQYDSMSDMLSFGMAPALVAYNWGLAEYGKFGWLAAFIYVACAALRLARFNANLSVTDGRFFQGLASPAAAAIVAGMVWSGSIYQIDGDNIGYLVGILTILTGLLMVSNFRYNSFKDLNWRDRVSFLTILLVVLVFVVIAARPAEMLFSIFFIYACSGPITTIRSVRKLKLEHVVGDSNDADFAEQDAVKPEDDKPAAEEQKNN